MANKIYIDVIVDDKGTTKRVAVDAKKLDKALDGTAKSARTADRNLKGAAAASANSTKNFSKMAQGAGGLVGVYATLAAQAFAVSAAFRFLQDSMNFQALIAGQEALGASTGVAYKTITASLIEATDAQLHYADAAKAAAIGTAAGLSSSQLEDLATAAKNTSAALGRDLTDSFDRLVRGVTKAEPELLDELGIILRLETATKNYAASLGKTAKELTAYERSQAVAIDVLDQAEKKFGQIEELMDPTTRALNQFGTAFNSVINDLRSSLAGPVGSIAIFLTENINTLLVSMTAFGVLIAKSLLPSLDSLQEKAASSVSMHDKAIKSATDNVKNYKREIAKVSQTQDKMLEKAELSAEKLLAGKSTRGTKTASFLLGNTDDIRAQRAANQVLLKAEKDLEKSLAVRSGMLKGFNKTQVADLRKTYQIRTGVLSSFEKKSVLSIKRIELEWKLANARMSKVWNKTMGTMAKGWNLFTRGLAALGWVGAIVGAFLIVKDVWDSVFEDTALKELNEGVDNLTDKFTTLSKELETAATQRAKFTTSLEEYAVSQANTINSIDINNFIDQINNLSSQTGADNFEDLRAEMLEVASIATEIDNRFSVLADSIANMRVDPEQAKILRNVAVEYGEFQTAVSTLPQLASATEQSLSKLVGSATKPFAAEFLDNNLQYIDALKTITEGYKTSLVDIQRAQEALVKPEAPVSYSSNMVNGKRVAIGPVQTKDITDPSYQQALADYKNSLEEQDKRLKDAEESLAAYNSQLRYQEILQQKLAGVAPRILKYEKDAVLFRKQAAIEGKAGLTIEEQINNARVAQYDLFAKVSEARSKQVAAEAAYNAAEAEYAQNQAASARDRLDARRISLETATAEVEIASRSAEIESVRVTHTIAGLNAKLRELEVSERLLHNEREVENSLAQQLALVNSGVQNFGVEQAEMAASLQKEILENKIAIVNQELASIEAQRHEFELTKQLSRQDSLRFDEQRQAAEDRLATLERELYLAENRYAILMNTLAAEKESLQLKIKEASLDPATVRTQELIRQTEIAENGPLSEDRKRAIYEEVKAVEDLKLATESLDKIYSSATDNMVDGLASVIDGSKSVKDAFADMATSILKDLAQVIAKMLIMKAISTAFGGGFGGGATTTAAAPTGSLYNTGPNPFGFSSGGIASGSDQGYPAILHGTEAVVPLPDNRAIPVELSGSTGQNNNVTVNVAIDNQGMASTNTDANGASAANLGNMVARAVQRELQNQKRSGGILNPYGVA